MKPDKEPRVRPGDGAIPLSVPHIAGNEWHYVKECLDTGWVSSVGRFVTRFECELAAYVGVRHAVATASGTAALHTALMVAGIGTGDEVLVSTLTFIAPANAIRYVGARPVFIDADPVYWQMDPERVAQFLESRCSWNGRELWNKTTGGCVRAIMPVHILGHPVDMDPIMELATRYNLIVIEDASESLGAKYKGQLTGTLGHIGCFSFNGNKIITTGGGGMLVTNNSGWAASARHLTTQAKDDPIEYVHNSVGYNYRLTNVQAAIGCAQLELLSEHISSKRAVATKYAGSLANLPGVTLQAEAPWAFSTFWLYTILLEAKVLGRTSRDVLDEYRAAGIETRPLWQPIHLSVAHRDGVATGCRIAERLHRDALSLPCSAGIRDEELRRVIRVLAPSEYGHVSPSHNSTAR